MPTEAELREHKLKVLAATAEGIQRDLDSLLMGAYNLYDVGRAIPHPYDAIGGMASKFLHDFRGTASTIQSYIELAKSELALLDLLAKEHSPVVARHLTEQAQEYGDHADIFDRFAREAPTEKHRDEHAARAARYRAVAKRFQELADAEKPQEKKS